MSGADILDTRTIQHIPPGRRIALTKPDDIAWYGAAVALDEVAKNDLQGVML